MKTCFYIILLLCIPCLLCAQLHIQRGASMVAQGDAKIVLNNASFLNDGGFTPGNSTILFTGQNKMFAGGSTRTAFFNLAIEHDVQLWGDISISGKLIMDHGNLELNNHRLDLGTTGMIDGEKLSSRITGANGGVITTTALLNTPVNANPGNIGISITSNSNLGPITITRGHVQQINADGKRSIQRYYDIPAVNTDLKLHYFEPELAGNDQASLVLWKLNNNRFTMGAGKASLTAYPNPARDKFTLTFYSDASKKATMTLQDAQGHVLERRQGNITSGLNTVQWNIAMHAQGTYYVAVENSSMKVKVVKQ